MQLNLRKCRFAWFQKFSVSLIWFSCFANHFDWSILRWDKSHTSKAFYPDHIRAADVIRLDALLNDGHEHFCSRIGYFGRINLPVALQ